MAIIKSCCGFSLRKGSFLTASYTLIMYTILVMVSALHLEVVSQTPGLLAFTVILIVIFGFCVISSVLLIIGLCVESKILVAPWLIAIVLATLADAIYTIISLFDSEVEVNSTFVLFFMLSIAMCLLNIYSLFVVGSQYQLYRKDSKRRMENISAIIEKNEVRTKNQTEKPRMENLNTSYQLYNDYDHDDIHSINPSHASLVSSEIPGLSSCKPKLFPNRVNTVDTDLTIKFTITRNSSIILHVFSNIKDNLLASFSLYPYLPYSQTMNSQIVNTNDVTWPYLGLHWIPLDSIDTVEINV